MGGRYEKKADPFYLSPAWRAAREQALLRDQYICQECLRRFRAGTLAKARPARAEMVHHIIPRALAPERALDLNNLESLCGACHNQKHPERGFRKRERPPDARRVIVIGNEVGRDDG